jgi:hypothetical protein
MVFRAATKAKLELSTKILAREFKAVPHALIASEIEATAARLLEGARFDDFVPILTHRYVRDRLKDPVVTSALADAA